MDQMYKTSEYGIPYLTTHHVTFTFIYTYNVCHPFPYINKYNNK